MAQSKKWDFWNWDLPPLWKFIVEIIFMIYVFYEFIILGRWEVSPSFLLLLGYMSYKFGLLTYRGIKFLVEKFQRLVITDITPEEEEILLVLWSDLKKELWSITEIKEKIQFESEEDLMKRVKKLEKLGLTKIELMGSDN